MRPTPEFLDRVCSDPGRCPVPLDLYHAATSRDLRPTRWARAGQAGRGGSASVRSWSGPLMPALRCFGVGSLLRTGFRQVVGPIVHEPTPMREQVRPGVGSLHLVLDHMRQRRLDDLARMVRLLGRPVPEQRAEAVRRRMSRPRFKPQAWTSRRFRMLTCPRRCTRRTPSDPGSSTRSLMWCAKSPSGSQSRTYRAPVSIVSRSLLAPRPETRTGSRPW